MRPVDVRHAQGDALAVLLDHADVRGERRPEPLRLIVAVLLGPQVVEEGEAVLEEGAPVVLPGVADDVGLDLEHVGVAPLLHLLPQLARDAGEGRIERAGVDDARGSLELVVDAEALRLLAGVAAEDVPLLPLPLVRRGLVAGMGQVAQSPSTSVCTGPATLSVFGIAPSPSPLLHPTCLPSSGANTRPPGISFPLPSATRS
jgi:hypothetical protein